MFKLSILEDRIQLTKTGNRVVKPTLGLATQGHKLLTLATKDGLHVEARFLTYSIIYLGYVLHVLTKMRYFVLYNARSF